MQIDEPEPQQLMSRKAAAEYPGTTVAVMAVWVCFHILLDSNLYIEL